MTALGVYVGRERTRLALLRLAFRAIVRQVDSRDLEALEGVAKFPARVKCATLVMQAFEKGLREHSIEEGENHGGTA